MKKNVISVFFVLGFCFSVFAQSSEILDELSAKQNLQAEEFSANVQTAMSNPNYIVTAGDVYSLNYSAGGTPVSYTIPVDSTYKIRVANLAVLDVKGKTYLSVKKEIENIVIRNYPMSGVQFVLLNPASFTVVVKGEVTSTFEKRAWALTRLSDVLKTGLTGRASTRNIVITDKDGKSKTVDLFKARREGDLSQNPYVRPGDVITVGRLERKVEIRGEVERPGTYELLSGENLKDLVERYGNGLTEFANTEKIGLVRKIKSEAKSGEKVYLDSSAIEQDYKLYNGDEIEITSIKSLMPTIVVEGIIANPNSKADSADNATDSAAPLDTSYKTYIRFYTGENYATLIRRISGMFNSYSDLKNAYIERNGEKLTLDIEHILYDAELMSDKTVMANDRLVIPYQQHLQKVLISGEVKGVVEENAWPLRRLSQIIKDNLTAYSSTRNVIVRNVEGEEKVYDLFLARRDGDLSQDPYIRSGETIIVGRLERKVEIRGEVERPGTYELLSGENLKDLVERYGNGLTEFANTEKIGLVRKIKSEAKSGEKVYLDSSAIEQDYKLYNGDEIEITSIKSLMPTIVVEGIIANPNSKADSADNATDSAAPLDTSYKTYIRFYTGENYATLIRRISGMFNSYSDLKNAYIERNGEKLTLDIEHILYDAELMSDKTVMANDRLVIPYQQHLQKVLISGEVKGVVEENAWPLRRLSQIIKDNLTAYSSTRNVIVRNVEGEEKVYDLFLARRDGDLSQDPYIRSGETIIVGRLERKVEIRGEVERPGTYELLSGENLKDLVERYGNGLTEFANTEKIGLVRKIKSEAKSGEKVYLDSSAIEQDYKLYNGDEIEITSIKSLMPTIVVEGIIANPNSKADSADNATDSAAPLDTSYKTYIRFYTGENYATLIRRISGMFNSYSDLKNAYIERNGEKLTLDIEHILYDAELMSDKTVMANDRLVIPYQQHLQKVLISGEVKGVVEENAWPLRRLSQIIKDNLTAYSSTRNVIVRNVEGEEKVYDLFLARRDGDLSQDPYIRSGETIIVGRLERKVEIRGEVERPGTYELLSGENLKDLVERYGNGLTEFADLSRIEILKAKTENSVVGEKFYIKASGLDDPQIAAYKVDCYDTIYIDSFNNLKPSIFVEGAVIEGAGKTGTELVASNKLSLVFNPGENYAFFVRNHRGIFTSVSDLENAYITRNGEYIPVDLNLMLYDASYYSDLVLEKDDILTVPFKQFFVSVAGAVNKPGRYPFIPDRGFDYYVGLAGGFDTNKNSMEMVEIIDVNGKKHKKNEKILPEYTITAKTNSFLYYFNHYAPVITTLLSIVSTTITVFAVVGK